MKVSVGTPRWAMMRIRPLMCRSPERMVVDAGWSEPVSARPDSLFRGNKQGKGQQASGMAALRRGKVLVVAMIWQAIPWPREQGIAIAAPGIRERGSVYLRARSH